MSAQRRRNRRAAAASDSLASLMMLPSSSSSSARKKQSSKHHHHHRSSATPSSLERIANNAAAAAATPIISAEESSAAAATPHSPSSRSSDKKSTKSKHSGKRSHLSMTTSLSTLAIGPDKQQAAINNTTASPQKKSHKKKRQMSPRSKSKLDSLVTQQQQQPQHVEDDTEEKWNEKLEQQRLKQSKDAEPIVKGSLVMVAPRTWPGMNKLGGVGRVIAVHSSASYDLDSNQQKQQNNEEEGGSSNNVIDASTTTTYDVSYVLGGKDKHVEAEYVSLHDTTHEVPRERHQRTSILMLEPERDRNLLPTKSVKKKRKMMTKSVTTEASPTKKKESSKKGNSTTINSNFRGKQLKQLKQVRDQHVASAKEEEDSTPNNLKSPAFSLSSQFSKQDGTLSPLDYLADSYPKIETPVLEAYSEKWSNSNELQQLDQQQNPEEEEEEEDEEERDDDPSSSVVSTDEDGSGFTPPREPRRHASPVKFSKSDLMKGHMSPPSENKSLEREYGRLALKKQEIERKMKMYKSDAEKINPWATASARGSNVDTNGSSLLALSPPSRSEAVVRRSHRDVTDGNDYPITRYSAGVPSREEVEFGELVYQRNLADRRMAELKDGYPKRSKPKKKRRRRVVETITRVIHEESEDDASSISDRHLQSKGSRYGRGYYDSPDRNYSRQSFDRRRSGSSDSEFASRSRDQNYAARQHSSQRNHAQGLESRKRRHPEQAASSAGRKTKSRPSSMLEDLD